jgi:hypothetical protein
MHPLAGTVSSITVNSVTTEIVSILTAAVRIVSLKNVIRTGLAYRVLRISVIAATTSGVYGIDKTARKVPGDALLSAKQIPIVRILAILDLWNA